MRVGDEVEHTVSEGDGPVNALDGALRKALHADLPAPGARCSWSITRCASSTPRPARRPASAWSSNRATATTSGAPSASARTSSRRAGWRWSTAIEYKLFKDDGRAGLTAETRDRQSGIDRSRTDSVFRCVLCDSCCDRDLRNRSWRPNSRRHTTRRKPSSAGSTFWDERGYFHSEPDPSASRSRSSSRRRT